MIYLFLHQFIYQKKERKNKQANTQHNKKIEKFTSDANGNQPKK